MLPELPLPGGAVSTWAVCAVFATSIAVVVSILDARRQGFAFGILVEAALVVVLSGWLGAKLAHVVFEAQGHELSDGTRASGVVDLLRDDPWHWARLFDGGHVFYGGIVTAVVVGVWFLRRAGVGPLALLFDAATPGILTGIVIGRLGCFLGGCCYGVATTMPWAVHFPAAHETHGLGVHPVQLYDLAVGVVGLVLWRSLRSRAFAPGMRFVVLAAAYAVARALTEMVRADDDRGSFGPLSTSQVISIVVFVVAIGAGARLRSAERASAGKAPLRHDPIGAS